MDYIVFVRIDGDWREIARVDAADHAEAIRKGELALPTEYKGRAMGLKPMGASATAKASTRDESGSTPT